MACVCEMCICDGLVHECDNLSLMSDMHGENEPSTFTVHTIVHMFPNKSNDIIIIAKTRKLIKKTPM